MEKKRNIVEWAMPLSADCHTGSMLSGRIRHIQFAQHA